jgi:hypothetical protein
MEELGCTGQSLQPYIFPPLHAEYHGDRISVNRCPVRLITGDLVSLFRAHQLADGKLSLSEQAELPGPFLDAWDAYGHHHGLAAVQRAKDRK